MTTQHVLTLDSTALAAARSAVLDPGRRYPFPLAPRCTTASRALDELVPGAAAHGVAAVQLAEPLAPRDLLRLGGTLGGLIPETAPAVRHRVTAGRILNLVTDVPETADVDQQPFAANWLLMHTESSARPPASQPRHLLFQCLAEAASLVDGQTVVVPSDSVASQLSPTDLTVLGHVRYCGARHPLVRWEAGRPVFSFRDPGSRPLALDADCRVPADRVGAAVTALLTALYRTEEVYAVPWRQGLLVLLDNHRVFHGRTRSSTTATGRHLQRLRITAPEGGPHAPKSKQEERSAP